MAEFAPANVVGNEILDIGSRKARRQRDEFSVAKLASIMGTPGQFDIPNVANVRSIMERFEIFKQYDAYKYFVLCTFTRLLALNFLQSILLLYC